MLAFGLLVATVALFIWGRFRYDLISLGALLAGVLIGVVPAAKAFDGFKNDIVAIIASALVVSAAFARSGVIETALGPLLARAKDERALSPILTVASALLSMATKNVGALAILMPVALQAAKRTGASPSRLLMPMSFASLMGGLVTLVGTSPNIIVSAVREQTLGKPFGMYDFAPVGLSLTAIALVFLAVAYRLLPTDRRSGVSISAALAASNYVTEAEAPADWAWESRRVADITHAGAQQVRVMALVRGGQRKATPHPNTLVRRGDIVLLEGEQAALHRLISDLRLKLHRPNTATDPPASPPREEVRSVEAVVAPHSPVIGSNAGRLNARNDLGVKLVAVARGGRSYARRLGSATLRAGDVLVLRGAEGALAGAMTDLGLLPLAEREVQLGATRLRYTAPVILALAMLLVGFKVLPVAIAFLAAAVAMVAFGAIPMREAYASLDGPVLVLIAALIPVSEAVQNTGGGVLMAHVLAGWLQALPPLATVAVLMATAMLSAPFLHNAPTVLILGPVAVGVGRALHISPDPLLMAVATGAACDFLTPIGHQCNTLVMAPGGYRFSDYPRLGAPLSLIVVTLGAPIIATFWPLADR